MAEFIEVMNQKKRMCKYNDDWCAKCPISSSKNGTDCDCTSFLNEQPQEAEKIIMDWAKEHPPVTNAIKAREILGFSEDEFDFVGCLGIKCPPDINGDCESCPKNGFWDKEWKPKEKDDES